MCAYSDEQKLLQKLLTNSLMNLFQLDQSFNKNKTV